MEPVTKDNYKQMRDEKEAAAKAATTKTTGSKRKDESSTRIEAINPILVDFFLWDLRRKKAGEIDSSEIPFHKTRCIFY